MIFIISPAKKMNEEEYAHGNYPVPASIRQTSEILAILQGYSLEELQSLWKCSEEIAKHNIKRLENMDLNKNLSAALLSYEGIQYQYMAPHVFQKEEMDYIETHLRILSGFYGVLKPFDGVTPYRLELAARLPVGTSKNLYDYWGDSWVTTLIKECDCIINLASKEYSKGVLPYLPKDFPCITISFRERKEGIAKEKATLCKMARGKMVRWATEQAIEQVEDLKNFQEMGFIFSPEDSTSQLFVFIKDVSIEK